MKESNTPQSQDSTAKDASQTKNKGTGSKSVTTGPKSAPTTNETDDPDNSNNPSKILAWLKKHVTATLVVELLVLLVGIKVASIYSDQLGQMRESVKIAHDTFVSANKPSVGIHDVKIIYSGRDKKGNAIGSLIPTKETDAFQFFVEIKNFGQISAEGFEPTWKLLVNGKDRTDHKANMGHDSVIFPGNTLTVIGRVGPPDYLPVMAGQETVEMEVAVKYQGAERNYTYCEKTRFQPELNAFVNLGATCTNK